MAEEISHKGKIIAITPQTTTVEIVSASACSACHAKGLCGLGESKSKVIEVPTSGWRQFSVGDEVEVALKASMGHKAVWLAYVFPLVVLLGVIMCLTLFSSLEEGLAGLAGIAAVGLYYCCLWLFRGKLQNEYIFNIK